MGDDDYTSFFVGHEVSASEVLKYKVEFMFRVFLLDFFDNGEVVLLLEAGLFMVEGVVHYCW